MVAFTVASASANDLNESDISTVDEIVEINENNEDIQINNDKLGVQEDAETVSTNFTPHSSSEIQNCINNAKVGDTIVLDGYYLVNSTINVTKQLNFVGVNNATIDGNNKVGLFRVSPIAITFKNITFINAKSNSNRGGAISCTSDASSINNYVENCTFIGNSASYGGAISGACVAVNCIFERNYAQGIGGGAVYSCSAVNCTFTGNSANDSHGGAIYSGSAVNCIFINNTAGSYGAMVYGSAVNCTFIHNSANEYGGAISCDAVNCTFTNNSAKNGGAMRYGSAVNCTFTHNSANEDGGAVFNSNLQNCRFIENYAKNNGGAISSEYYKYTAINCTFEKNHANNGGATHKCTVIDCNFISNYATSHGGASYYCNVVNSTFEKNHANTGGAISGDNNEMSNCIFINNSAKNGGAAYNILALNCNFTDNNATGNGGALLGGFAINTIFNENHANNGGAVYNGVVANSIFDDNVADNDGGAMSGEKATNCTFLNNHAGRYGGAVYNAEISTNSQFQNNVAMAGNECDEVIYFEIGKTFSDLEKLFDNNLSEIYINNNYTFEFGLDFYLKEGIVVNRNITVYGNGFTLNGMGISRIFNVTASNVLFKDLIFINGYANSNGAAINGKCMVEKCSFVNNSGWALYSADSALNCTFIGNSGGCMFDGTALNCNFINNTGLAFSGKNRYGRCNAINCWFENNSGGAMMYGNAVNCTFMGNSATSGGAIHSGSAVNCTFVANSATQMGGAVFEIDAVNCIFINNSNTYSESYSDFGGGAMNRGSARNCTFINNTASKYGGAISSSSAEKCIFIGNSARYGGAINCWYSMNNCTFINNSANYGSAINFEDRTSTVVNCNFINNNLNDPYRRSSIVNCTIRDTKSQSNINAIDCSFINNSASLSGDATNCVFINNSGSAMSGTAINCRFIGNSATNGGAMGFGEAFNCTFINNSATNEGGAIFRSKNIVNCTFINNTAGRGGAIKGSYTSYYGDPILSSVENCTFINNSAIYGGAIIDAISVTNSVFINNSATFGGSLNCCFDLYYSNYGGTRYLGTFYTNVDNCSFIRGSAKYGGAIYDGNAVNCSFVNISADYGGAIYLDNDNNITYCNFTNCFANFKGGAIYINQSGSIIHCIFEYCTSDVSNNSLDTNSSTDYTIMDCIFDEYPDNIKYHYVSSLVSGNLTYFNGEEGILLANLSDVRGVLNNQIVYISIGGKRYNVTTDSNGIAYFYIQNYLNKAGIYNTTVIFEGDNINNPSSTNVTITVNKHDSILNVPELVLYKNEYGILIGNLNNARGPLADKTIVFTLDGVNYRRNTDQNGVVEFNVLNYLDGKGKFDLNVTFGGDDFNNPSSTNVSVYIIDFRGILSCNVDGKYYNDTILVFSLINYKNNKPIYNAPIKLVFSNGEIVNLTTDVDGSASYRIPFRPGNYDVTSYVDQEYVDVNNITINDIEINKMFGQISHELLNGNKTLLFKLFNPVNLDVFRNVKINLAFNNQVTAEIITNDAGIAVYDIPFPKGIYSVYIRVNGSYTQFQEDHINNIVVTNDLNCSLNFTNNITFAFGEYGSTDFTVEGGTVELDKVKVIDHPEALISISNNTISVFGLSVGNYVLEVETTPDEYHNAVIGRVNITVTNAPSKVTFSTGLLFEYGGSISINVVVIGGFVERNNIKIVGHPEANIILKGNVITISGLAVGNYKLQVTSTPDSDHIASTETVSVTVKKATAVIKASKITVAYKKAGKWTIKFVDSKSGNAISNMMVTLKVYTGKKFKTVSLKTNSKGEATYQTKKLAKGTHKVVVSAKDSRYNFNTFTSSIKVIKQTAVKFKVTKKTFKDGASLSITVKNKKTKKPINGVKIELLIYTGSKLTKTVLLKTLKKGKYSGVAGYATNELKAGKHKVKITTADIKYGGSAKSSMKITKQAKKYPALSTKISAKV